VEQRLSPLSGSAKAEQATPAWRTVLATGAEARLLLGRSEGQGSGHVWLAHTDMDLAEPTAAQFLASSSGGLRIWLNGEVVYQRAEARAFRPDSDRFDATLQK